MDRVLTQFRAAVTTDGLKHNEYRQRCLAKGACNRKNDSLTMNDYTVRGKVVVLAASTLESARILLLSKSRLYPNGLANSSGHVGHNFCEHLMGPRIFGQMKELVGK